MENMIKNETRRDFLKVSGTVAGGLALGFYLPTGPRIAQAAAETSSPNAWIKIGTDNSITIMCARSEMGQDVYTSMTMLVTGPGGKKATYGQLAAKAATMEVPKDVPLKPSSQFKVVGNMKQKRLDTVAKVNGTAQFGIDTRVPGMLYAAVAMAPMIGGKVA